MKYLLKFEIKKLLKSKNLYINIFLLIMLTYLVVIFNYKDNKYNNEFNYVKIEKRVDIKFQNEIDNNNKIVEYIDNNNIDNNDKIKNTFNNILTLLMFLSFIIFLSSSKILANEYETGTIKNLLIKPYNRNKIFFSKYIIIIFLFITYFIIVYLSSLLFISLIYKVNIFALKSYILKKEIIEILYLNKFTVNYILSSIPVLFLSLMTYNISVITFNSYISYLTSICLITFSPIISNSLFNIKIKFIEYTFLPYLDYKFLLNKLDLYYLNYLNGINLSLFNGTFILIITLIITTIVSMYVFKTKDIKK